MDKSYLYTPALKVDALAKNNAGHHADHCDVAVLDLEDSIHLAMKANARQIIFDLDHGALKRMKKLSLRLNAIDTLDGIKDMEMLGRLFKHKGCRFDSVFVSKIRHHRDLVVYRRLFDAMAPAIKLITIIETVEAIEDLDEIAKYSDALILGQADLMACLYAHNQSFINNARAKICVYAAKYNITAIDTNSFEIDDMILFKRQCVAARQEGFMAKAAIHPVQLDIINQVFEISDKEQQKFEDVIDIYSRSVSGFSIHDGRIIAPPFIANANKMLDFIARNK
ncbi:MAG: aldolase [Algicola sp.]|nr:aldolase [Algicola sp.]